MAKLDGGISPVKKRLVAIESPSFVELEIGGANNCFEERKRLNMLTRLSLFRNNVLSLKSKRYAL
ncbi:hypothetical protein [Dysgonomonas sp. 25]|uniref:hypothetical protein n=1 Tax=Dysgonomonas sp. 25 TaxID=2302933 RepID=UPI001C86724C|nr:hypothetical protein [Dysgonomonas sp. 25]NDV70103.1 hypothetical protein [Dysgonomonas sp. 25]